MCCIMSRLSGRECWATLLEVCRSIIVEASGVRWWRLGEVGDAIFIAGLR